MSEQQVPTTNEWSELEIAAAEGLMMLSRSWRVSASVPQDQEPQPEPEPEASQADDQPTAFVSGPSDSENNSPTEAEEVPENYAQEELSRSYSPQETQASASAAGLNDSTSNAEDMTAKLSDMVRKAIHDWRATTAGADRVPTYTLSWVIHKAALGYTQNEPMPGPSGINMPGPSGTNMPGPSGNNMPGPSGNNTPGPSGTNMPGPSGTNMPGPSRINTRARSRRSALAEISPTGSNKENIIPKAEELSSSDTSSDDESEPDGEMIPIGDGYARVPAYVLKMINWGKFKIATRHLLVAVFGRETLATHNLTGKPSPAFPNRAPRGKLDPNLVNDIIQTVVQRCAACQQV